MIIAAATALVLALSAWPLKPAGHPPPSKQFATGKSPQMTCSPLASRLVVDEAAWKAKVGWFKGTLSPALGQVTEGRPTYDYSCHPGVSMDQLAR